MWPLTLLMVFSLILIVISLFTLKKGKKAATFLLLLTSFLFAMTQPGWYILLDGKYDLYLALLFGVISALLILVFSSKKERAENRGFILLVTFMLWFSLFRGTTRANFMFCLSDEQIVNVQVEDAVAFGAGRGDFLYYFGYKNTEISCDVLNNEVVFEVPTNACKNLSAGDNIVVGIRDGFVGMKFCYVIFDENHQVAKQLPQKRTEGRYIIKPDF